MMRPVATLVMSQGKVVLAVKTLFAHSVVPLAFFTIAAALGSAESQLATVTPEAAGKGIVANDPAVTAKIEVLRVELRSPIQETRKKAAESLLTYGAAARLALPELVDILLDPEDKAFGYCSELIQQIGGPAMVPMIEAYRKTTTAQQRLSLIWLLGELYKQEENAELGAILLHALTNDPSEMVRCSVMRYVAHGDIAKRAFPILMGYLEDKKASAALRGRAARSLGRFGAQAKRAIPLQIEIVQDECNRSHVDLASESVGGYPCSWHGCSSVCL
jgi:HEAT repeat protein